MPQRTESLIRTITIWAGLLGLSAVTIALAAASPYLEWREPIYIIAGFAGVFALALLLIQPLLAAGLLPALPASTARRYHHRIGATILACVVLHVAGLWITSPPDVVDALLFRSPTPFSIWGVIAMWALFATACLAALRQRFKGKLRTWRMAHSALALLIVSGTVIHAALIEGTMETLTKYALSAAAVMTLALALRRLGVWRRPQRVSRG